MRRSARTVERSPRASDCGRGGQRRRGNLPRQGSTTRCHSHGCCYALKTGIEATREIHGTLPHIQIVGLSTYGDETTELAMPDAGAQAYFSKTESTHRLFDY